MRCLEKNHLQIYIMVLHHVKKTFLEVRLKDKFENYIGSSQLGFLYLKSTSRAKIYTALKSIFKIFISLASCPEI